MHTTSDDNRGLSRASARALRPLIGALIATAGLAVAIPGQAADLKARFDQLSFGITEEAVVSLMGSQPTSSQQASTFGVLTSRLRWEENLHVYQVSLMFGRLIEKKECSMRSEC